jgi:hypothetical protein
MTHPIAPPHHAPRRRTGYVPAAAASLISAFVSLGFSTVALFRPAWIVGSASGEAWVFAAYCEARSLVVAAAVLVAIARRSSQAVVVVGLIAGAIQAIDALVGMVLGDPAKSIGPAALAAVTLIAVWRLHASKATGH